jgi:threonine/homoserine/homoserine lactone efflux protein
MSTDTLLALTAFAFATSGTPGPNNLMLLASGARFGMRRTVPHMLGISLGFAVMLVLVGAGIYQVIAQAPALGLALKIACVGFLLWLAFKLVMAPPLAADAADQTADRPLSFVGAALFQWVNPKAWAMALSAVSLYAADGSLPALLAVALVFLVVNLPTVSMWAYAGERLRAWLTTERRARTFNVVMAVLLVLSVLPML